MLIWVMLGMSALAGSLVALQARRWPAADPGAAGAIALGSGLRRRDRLVHFIRARLDPAPATGLALTIAAVVVVTAGVIVGVLVYLLRTHPALAAADLSVARWAASRASSLSTSALRVITALGSTLVVIAVGTSVAVTVAVRSRRGVPVAFMLLVLAGQSAIVQLVKILVGRARPGVMVLTGYHGQSFPSGHSAAAAACYGAIAVLLSARWSSGARSKAYGGAVAVAVAVACSRVSLGVHWVSDVVAGLAVGWGWLALASIAFGGRLLWFGAPVEVAETPRAAVPAEKGAVGSAPQ